MDGDGEISKKNKVFEFAENHPYILLIVIAVLVIMVVSMFLQSRGYFGSDKMTGKRKKSKKSELSGDDEMDDLIESIHKKQKRKKQVG